MAPLYYGAILLACVAATYVVPTALAGTPEGRELAMAACQTFNISRKIEIMHGFGKIDGYSRNSGCGYECGRKTFRWDNGPQGFGDGTIPGTTTQWPCTLSMGATFDPELAGEWGVAMGEEFYGKGTNIQEGPGVNVARVMVNGRNFEYVSGEDPYLGIMMVQPIVAGIQQNVMAIAKHYINNNQEFDRSGVNEVVDEVTNMELYSPPFAAAAKAAAGFMCSYNRINGVWACENEDTLKTMLKGYFNFTGFVVSDWGACHSTVDSINNGLDIEMPEGKYFTQETIQAALDAKNISMDSIDDSCVRILSGWYSLPEDRRFPCGGGICIDRNVSTPEHKSLARNIAAKSTVLLKNDKNLLPLSKDKKIALIGIDATTPYSGGQGSGQVVTNAVVSPMVAFQSLGVDVTYNEGTNIDDAVAAAKAADVVIVFGSAHTGEGHDRANLSLGANIDQVIPAVAAAQPNTVVVLSVPGSILTPWRDNVPAILTNFLPGEQVGPALGDVLFGDVAPQAKLPVTFPVTANDQGFTEEQYPGVAVGQFQYQANYSEGQIVGYRFYDKHQVTPAFPFGHGLTYGSFSYSNVQVSGRQLTFNITRTAGDSGCDTPQVYISYPRSTEPTVPSKVLRYFQKVCTDSAVITYAFSDQDVSNWDVNLKKWTVTSGTYGISIGSSSQDIRLKSTMTV